MTYKLGKRSKEKLEGVDERMIAIVRYGGFKNDELQTS